jgi:hypothetical protein
LVEAGPGFVEAGPGLVEAGPGLVEAALGLVDAGPGFEEVGPGFVEAWPSLEEAGPGLVEAGPGFDEVGPGLYLREAGPDLWTFSCSISAGSELDIFCSVSWRTKLDISESESEFSSVYSIFITFSIISCLYSGLGFGAPFSAACSSWKCSFMCLDMFTLVTSKLHPSIRQLIELWSLRSLAIGTCAASADIFFFLVEGSLEGSLRGSTSTLRLPLGALVLTGM